MLNKEQVKHVADLAKLNIDDKDIEKYSKQLSDILTEIEKIDKVVLNTDDIMISSTDNKNTYSNDVVGHMLTKEEIFKNVKHSNGDYIVVPKAIND